MDKINTFEEVKEYLKNNVIITSDGKDSFYYQGGYVKRLFNGNYYSIKFDNFCDLFKKTTFFIKEDSENSIDDEKDLEYYGRIQRMN